MSLLRAGPTRLATHALKSSTIQARFEATSAFNAAAVTQKPQTEVAPIPVPKDIVTADVVSGAPKELRRRVVRIFQPTRNTMQSGPAKGERWRIDWDVMPGGGRWENSLIGWASSADYMQGTRLTFRSREDAMHFAEKQGWDFYVQPPTVKKIPPKNYSENFVYKPSKLRLVRTK